ncbi:MAG: methylated-DNA--[protein]-cysteine S-methyltransferase [Rhodospirillaceae bacterium]
MGGSILLSRTVNASSNIKQNVTVVSRTESASDYARIEAAISYLLKSQNTPPGLEDLAAGAGLSPCHFQRLFKRWAGVSPKQFMSYISVERAKPILEAAAPVLEAALDAGLSGASRLHDLFVSVQAMTPGEYKAQGKNLVVSYGVVETPFGRALMLQTERGVCGIEFIDESEEAALRKARAQWPLSRFRSDNLSAAESATRIFGGTSMSATGERPRLLMKGTNFQIQVWAALLRVPEGAMISYSGLAAAIGKPSAARAVGSALAANTLAYAVPCHRVLRATGLFKSYRWGAPRRWAMLGWEAARYERKISGHSPSVP